MMNKRVTISWSGGKDSALALYKIRSSSQVEVVNLHTVINEETRRVGMHGVPEMLIERQAEAIGIPLIKLYLESSESHSAYSQLMKEFYRQCEEQEIHAVVFGDIFLEDLKNFREDLLRFSALSGVFPLWKNDTADLINEFIASGFKTLVCSANAKYFPVTIAGQIIDRDFIRLLPEGVDRCGERGEFHTFVYDGPIFHKRIDFKPGNVIEKTYHYQSAGINGNPEKHESVFWFQELLP